LFQDKQRDLVIIIKRVQFTALNNLLVGADDVESVSERKRPISSTTEDKLDFLKTPKITQLSVIAKG